MFIPAFKFHSPYAIVCQNIFISSFVPATKCISWVPTMCQASCRTVGLLICLHEAFPCFLPHKISSPLSPLPTFQVALSSPQLHGCRSPLIISSLRSGMGFPLTVWSLQYLAQKQTLSLLSRFGRALNPFDKKNHTQQLTKNSVTASLLNSIYIHNKVPKHTLLMSRRKSHM